MKLSEFDFYLPKSQVAQYPARERDSSRLFVIHRKQGRTEHLIFRDITKHLRHGDILVLNNTKVLNARLYGRNPSGRKVEILLMKELQRHTWQAITKGAGSGPVVFSQGVSGHISHNNGDVTVTFTGNDIKGMLSKIGVMPLPPYIKRPADELDEKYYQTVYAEKEGAIAAPTAGLHFSIELLDRIKEKGVEVKKLTLHVGHGTFKPVSSTEIEKHRMGEETYEIPEDTASAINRAKSEGRRVIAVGTTVTRALESSVKDGIGQRINSGTDTASLFIYPGFKFRIIDALITNFHLPKSTPFALTAAFSDLNVLRGAYSEALTAHYRFFSYGDAMFII